MRTRAWQFLSVTLILLCGFVYWRTIGDDSNSQGNKAGMYERSDFPGTSTDESEGSMPAASLRGRSLRPRFSISALLEQADKALSAKDLEFAESCARRVLEKDSNNLQAHEILKSVAEQNKSNERLEKEYKEFRERSDLDFGSGF